MPRRSLILTVSGLALAGVAVPATADASQQLGDRVLRLHSQGPDVKQLQRALTALDIPATADGAYGRRTRTAVKRYERAHKMTPDGRVSRKQGRGIARRAEGGRQVTQTQAVEVPGAVASLSADGLTANVPADAPAEVKAAIVAANQIVGKPYRWGGGHGDWEDSGYDCSGAVSYALHGAGLLKRPLASGDMMTWAQKGKGAWITVYANGGHAYAIIAGLRFDTSGSGGKGPRWRPEARSARNFVARHPAGF